MRWTVFAMLTALGAGLLFTPAALAHEPSPEELEAMIASVSRIAWNARTLALIGLGAGALGLATGVLSLVVSLRRR